MSASPWLVTSEEALERLVRRLGDAPRIALDVEADGLFRYRARLCVLQVAWHDAEEGHAARPETAAPSVAIVDPLALDPTPLREILGAEGPTKVLHDLTFDARMLADAGLPLGNARDTSVSARFLGEPATGLARMVESRLGITLSKGLQDHDWARRPLGEQEVGYLADDVRHLLALDDALAAEVAARAIAEEVSLECTYKLATALRPPKDDRPAHAKIKGYGELDPVGRTVLRHLVACRERLAEEEDVPPFRVARSEVLLAIARTKPTSERELRRLCGRDRAARHVVPFRHAVARGVEDDPEERALVAAAPADLAERRALEKKLTAWRRVEAEARGVDPQVIVPGHCMERVAATLLSREADDLTRRLEAIEGFGSSRALRYGGALLALLDAG